MLNKKFKNCPKSFFYVLKKHLDLKKYFQDPFFFIEKALKLL